MNRHSILAAVWGILLAGFANPGSARAVVVFSEDFESATNASAIDISNTVFATSGATDGTTTTDMMPATLQIATDNLGPMPGPLFSSGTKYLQFSDQTANSRLLVSKTLPDEPIDPENAPNEKKITDSGFYLSLDYYEPSGFGPSSIRLFLANGTSATDNAARLVELALIDQSNAAGYYGPGFTLFNEFTSQLPIDMKHRIEVMGIIGTVAGGSISYLEGNESVVENTFDVWINGVRIVDNSPFRNAIEFAAIQTFGFSGNNSGAMETAYFDNILLRTDLPGASVSIDGDHNGDGFVNAADYAFWRDMMSGDMNGYDDWKANFGNSGGSATTSAVPEPSAWLLVVIVLACNAFRRK